MFFSPDLQSGLVFLWLANQSAAKDSQGPVWGCFFLTLPNSTSESWWVPAAFTGPFKMFCYLLFIFTTGTTFVVLLR